MISLAIAAGVALLALASWWSFREDVDVPVHQTALSEREFLYHCPNQHDFPAPGQVDPRPCPYCMKEAFPQVALECEEHGPFYVSFRFGIGRDGQARATHFRLRGGLWTRVNGGPRCPQCGQPLKLDPLVSPGSANRRQNLEPLRPRGREKGD